MSKGDVMLATQGRRLAGFVLDCFLIVITLLMGWVIWYLFVAVDGQSPGKRLLGIRVIRDDGTAAGLGWMLIRDWVVAALWCVRDADRQCVWDKIVRTRVVNARGP